MSDVKLYHGDCLIEMDKIADNSVDLILCDLPYGAWKNANIEGWLNKNEGLVWDNIIDTEKLFTHYERILRQNGIAILFSQEPYTSHLRTFNKINFDFLYPLIWKKDHFANGLICKKAPVSYFEDLSVFVKTYDSSNSNPLREYFKKVFDFMGKSKKEIINKIGQKADHCFRFNSMQYDLCTENTYKDLISFYGINKMDGFKTFSELSEINKKYNRTFNLQDKKFISNVLEFKKDYGGLHPTQKPVALLEYIIKIYTNENDLVLDNCMGSGSCGVACLDTNRNFIGIEKDDKYFEIAEKRIKEHQQSIFEI